MSDEKTPRETVDARRSALERLFELNGASVDRVDYHWRGEFLPCYYVYCNRGYSCHVYEKDFEGQTRLSEEALARVVSFCTDTIGWYERALAAQRSNYLNPEDA